MGSLYLSNIFSCQQLYIKSIYYTIVIKICEVLPSDRKVKEMGVYTWERPCFKTSPARFNRSAGRLFTPEKNEGSRLS